MQQNNESQQIKPVNSDLISVILPTYNRANYIRPAAESVLGQTYTALELIIIDDGSTDDTEKVLEDIRRDTRVRYIRQNNTGAAKARNHGLKLASGEYIAFIDSDDIWQKEKLGAQVCVMKALPQIGLVCSNFSARKNNIEIEKFHIKSYFDVFNTYNLELGDIFSDRLRIDERVRALDGTGEVFWGCVYETMLFGNLILTSTCLCRANIFNEVGVFNTSYPTLEDYDLFLRITDKYPIAFIDKDLIVYQYSDNQLSGENYFGKLCEVLIEIYSKNIDKIHRTQFYQNNRNRIKKRLGMYQGMAAYFHYSKGHRRSALGYYMKAVRNNPGVIKYYTYMALSILPTQINEYLKKIKRSIGF